MRNAKSLDPTAASVPTQKSGATDPARRRFLLALSAGSAAAAAAKASAMPVAVAPEAPASDQDAAYRESEHVRDYYRTTRI